MHQGWRAFSKRCGLGATRLLQPVQNGEIDCKKRTCQASCIVDIVFTDQVERPMTTVIAFTCYFYFSHSNPEAVE